MHFFYKLIAFSFIAFFSCCKNNYEANTHIPVDSIWKFRPDDSIGFAKIDYDDSLWDSISVTQTWENQGYSDYDGYAWYRTKVIIPSSIMNQKYPADSLKIYLGRIDEFDQTYLNGFVIGQNAVSRPFKDVTKDSLNDTLSYSRLIRKYVLHTSDKRILWDKENLIAVRVLDPFGKGGFYGGIPYFAMVSLEDHLTFDKNNFYKLPNNINAIKFDTCLTVKNSSSKVAFRGHLFIEVEDLVTNRGVFSKKFSFSIEPMSNKSLPVSLPISTNPLKVSLRYQDFRLGIQIDDLDTIPYVLQKF